MSFKIVPAVIGIVIVVIILLFLNTETFADLKCTLPLILRIDTYTGKPFCAYPDASCNTGLVPRIDFDTKKSICTKSDSSSDVYYAWGGEEVKCKNTGNTPKPKIRAFGPGKQCTYNGEPGNCGMPRAKKVSMYYNQGVQCNAPIPK